MIIKGNSNNLLRKKENMLKEMCTLCTLYQCVGDYAHLTVCTVLSFEGGVELIHRYHERARVCLLNLHVSSLCSDIDTMSVRDKTSNIKTHALKIS